MNRKTLLIGFLILNILTGLCVGVISMVLPLYSISINASTAEIGMIKGISGIGALMMVLPSGFLVDYFGSKRLYAFGSFISALTIFLMAFSNSAKLIMLSMAFQGFSNSLRFTSLNAAFFKYLNSIGVSKSGWYRGSMSIGLTFVGPLVGGYSLRYLSYQNIFHIVAMLTLIPTLALIPLLRKEYIHRKTDTGKEGNNKFNFNEQLWEMKCLLKDRILKRTILAEGLSTACFSSFSTFIVVYAVNSLYIKNYYSSWFLILEGTAYILMVFLGGGLLCRYTKERLYLVSFSLMISGLFFIGISYKLGIVILLGIILLGVGTGILNLVTYSNLSNIEGKKGKVSSLLSAATGIGSTFGPMFGGIIGEVFGYRAIFIVYIPIFILTTYYICSSRIKENEIEELIQSEY